MDLLDRVRSTLRRHQMITPASRVLVAVSGGPDSVALSRLLHALHLSRELTVAGLAHVNHQLRDAAAADQAFCAELAETLALPFDARLVDVRAVAARDRVSIEAAAHTARHRALREAADRLGADRIALGHTLDDQAETVLLRMIRGAGLKGLAGMHPRNGSIIRPLLETRRDALWHFLAAEGCAFRTDASNDDRQIPRNRVRAELLPWLEREFNPRVVEVLGAEAELAREDWRFLAAAADRLLAGALEQEGEDWRLRIDPFLAAPRAVSRAALRVLLERASGGRPIGLGHVERALALCAADGPDGAVDLPGQRMERFGAAIVLTSRSGKSLRGRARRGGGAPDAVEPAESRPGEPRLLPVPGAVRIPEAGCEVLAEVAGSASGLAHVFGGRGDMVALRQDRCEGPLTVRSRRPGDRVRLADPGGHKKLQDLFVDRKVPRRERDRVPIVVDRQGRIVWVAGHALGGEFRVTDPAQAVIILRLKVWGGPA